MKFIVCLFLGVLVLQLHASLAFEVFEPGPDYIYNQIYQHKGDVKPCVRLLHTNGMVGCSTSESGAVGTLYPIQTETELTAFRSEFDRTWIDSHAIVLAGHLFNKSVVEALHDTHAVSGILLLEEPPGQGRDLPCDGGSGFSPARKHPNKEWGLHPQSSHQWNPCGNDWFYQQIPLPVFAITGEEDTKFFLEKAKENKHKSNSWPKWAVEFNDFMWGSVDSPTCLRRGHCEPIGGQSVWSTVDLDVDPKKRIVFAIAQLDSNSIFQDLAIGGESMASGVAALLTAVDAIMDYRIRHMAPPADSNSTSLLEPLPKELVFGFFTGETWGYVGSRKFVDDLLHFKCKRVEGNENNNNNSPNSTAELSRFAWCQDPYKYNLEFTKLSLSRIDAILELNQVALLDEQHPILYMHREAGGTWGPVEATLRRVASAPAPMGLGVGVAPAFDPAFELPPSSLNTFLMADSSLPAIVLSDYSTAYKNKFYHSRWDDEWNVKNSSVCRAGNFLARALWALVHDADSNATVPDDLQANCSLTSMLLECLISNNTCQMKQDLLRLVGGPQPPTQYTGVYRSRLRSISLNAKFVHDTLIYLTSPQRYFPPTHLINCSTAACPKGMTCLMGICRNSSVYYHDALSLGIEWNQDWGYWHISDLSAPLWTESTWSSIGLRVFLQDNVVLEVTIAAFGLLEFALCMGLFWLGRRALLQREQKRLLQFHSTHSSGQGSEMGSTSRGGSGGAGAARRRPSGRGAFGKRRNAQARRNTNIPQTGGNEA
jgi:nicastrin